MLRLESCLKICQFHTKGFLCFKGEFFFRLIRDNNIDVITLHETHTLDDYDQNKRGSIPGYCILDAIHHKQYVLATFVKKDRVTTKTREENTKEGISTLIVEVCDVKIINVYKPPDVT